MWYRLSRREGDFRIECSDDGASWQQMRICHLHEAAGVVRVGVYTASPEESSFTARFSDISLGPCAWGGARRPGAPTRTAETGIRGEDGQAACCRAACGADRGGAKRVASIMRDGEEELAAPDLWLTEDMLAPDGEREPGDEGACDAGAPDERARTPFELPAAAYSSMERYREFVDGCFGRRGGFNPQDPVHCQLRIMLVSGAVIYDPCRRQGGRCSFAGGAQSGVSRQGPLTAVMRGAGKATTRVSLPLMITRHLAQEELLDAAGAQDRFMDSDSWGHGAHDGTIGIAYFCSAY